MPRRGYDASTLDYRRQQHKPFSKDSDYKPVKDPEVDVEASKAAKLRLLKFMEDEARILGI